MDRELSKNIIQRNRQKNILLFLGGILLLIICLFVFRNSLKTSLEKSKIRIAIAEVGAIENTLTASGEIIPEFEQVITSPIRAEIQKVLRNAGAAVSPGDAILQLDLEEALNEREKIKDQLELKRNAITQLKMRLDKERFDLEINNEIKGLTIDNLQAALGDEKRLLRIGGATEEDIEKAELNLKIGQLEKKQMENELRYKNESMLSVLREQELQVAIQEKELREYQRKLDLAAVIAKRRGVVTWVNENIGTSIQEGEALARVADLASFRVEASISDVYADRIKPEQEIIVRINEEELRGKIQRIKPTIENDIVRFIIQLEEKNHERLRPNMKVEVYIITAAQHQSIRVRNGPTFKGKKRQLIFVLKDGIAYRREVNIGLSNFDFVEIKDQLKAGEQVVISDMTKYEHLEEVKID